MTFGKWAMLLLAATLFLAGCGDFWQAPNGSSGTSTSFTLSNTGNITVTPPGATTDDTSTIEVEASSSFSGTVDVSCAVTTSPSNASYPLTCSLNETSVSLSDSETQDVTLTAVTTSTTTTGTYDITVTGSSSGVASETTVVAVCVEASSSGTGSCSSTTTADTSGDFYILNNGTTPQIVGESINSGTLTSLGSWTLPSMPYAMAIAPSGNFLYVSTDAGVYVYTISGGSLGTAEPVTSDLDVYAIQVDPTGSWLIEAIDNGAGSNEVSFKAVPISSSTGTEEENGTEVTATYPDTGAAVQPGQLAISENGSYIFAALGSGGAIAVPFNASATSGTSPFGTLATLIPVFDSSISSALSVAVDPTDRLFYVGETAVYSGTNSGGLLAYNYSSLGNSGGPTLATSIDSGGVAPNFILPITGGDYVYVGNGEGALAGDTGNITGFSVTASGSTYSLTSVGSVTAGTQPIGLAEDSTGTFVLGVNELGGPYFDAYTFDSSTGQLSTSPITSDTGSPIAIVAAP